MPTNVFDRLTGTAINLDGRDGPLEDDPGTPEDEYTLVLTIVPLLFEPGAQTSVLILASKNGLTLPSQLVSIATDNAAVGVVPAEVTTSTDGGVQFGIIGLDEGSATISASMDVAGVIYNATPVEITVAEQSAPEDYDATGYGRVILSCESPLANALQAKVQRLSHAEQKRKYPGDDGLIWATHFESATITIVPKALQ